MAKGAHGGARARSRSRSRDRKWAAVRQLEHWQPDSPYSSLIDFISHKRTEPNEESRTRAPADLLIVGRGRSARRSLMAPAVFPARGPRRVSLCARIPLPGSPAQHAQLCFRARHTPGPRPLDLAISYAPRMLCHEPAVSSNFRTDESTPTGHHSHPVSRGAHIQVLPRKHRAHSTRHRSIQTSSQANPNRERQDVLRRPQ